MHRVNVQFFYLFWDVPFACPRTSITHAAKQKAIVVVFVDDSRLSWSGKTIEEYVDHHMDRVFGKPDPQSLSEVIDNYIGIDIDAENNCRRMLSTYSNVSLHPCAANHHQE